MKFWKLLLLTFILCLISGIFLMWSLQTAWLGSFPGKDKNLYLTWTILQLGAALVAIAANITLWVKYWRGKK
ncbi:hypothetical protein [Paracidovorax konjaci]|uniref:hypothetical protein n=1 Tax=Paracidovorax konjaci TaxID=32040 RepID=UPI001113561A|nr:hypothetical protein [Paracidovorax konjaci]